MPRRSLPRLLKDEFTGYSNAKFRQDLLAGLTVAAVALPLALAFGVALRHLRLAPYLDLGLRLGEGTGAVLFIHLARAAARIYTEMATFKSAGVDGPA